MDKHIDTITVHHRTQVLILDALSHNETQSYSDLQPHELSGHEFGYHLQKLISMRLVVKSGSNYMLTSLGKLIADSSSYETNKLKIRPVAGVWIYVICRNKVLAYRSYRAPLFGVTCLPFGKLRIGESVQETITRICKKRHINIEDMREISRKLVNVRYINNGELVAHRYGSLVILETDSDVRVTETKNGHSCLADLEDIAEKLVLERDSTDFEVTV